MCVCMYVYQPVPSVEAGWNTSAVTPRIVGGDKKETHCLGL
jgi:hypothetical protein